MTAAVLLAALAAAPTVAVLQGAADAVSPVAVRGALADAQARLSAAGLAPVVSSRACGGKTACFAEVAQDAGAKAVLIVSLFSGPTGLTVDLDARSANGAALDVLTTGATADGHLPASSDTFFSGLAAKLSASDRPEVVKLTPEDRPVESAAPFSPFKPLLIAGGGLLVVSAGLFVVALVLANQLGGRLSGTGVITGITRAQAESQANLANGLATASLVTGLAGCASAGIGGVWALFGRDGSSELVEER